MTMIGTPGTMQHLLHVGGPTAMDGFMYLFHVPSGQKDDFLIPDDNVIDMVVHEHDLRWSGFVLKDRAGACGMLCLFRKRR